MRLLHELRHLNDHEQEDVMRQLLHEITIQIWSTSKLMNEEDLCEITNDIDNLNLPDIFKNVTTNLLDDRNIGNVLVVIKE